VAIFEYDPNDYTRLMSENFGIYGSFLLLFIGIIIAIIAVHTKRDLNSMVKIHTEK